MPFYKKGKVGSRRLRYASASSVMMLPETLQLFIRVPSFNQRIQNCNVDSKNPCRRFCLPVGAADLFLCPELSYRTKQTTNGSSAALPMAISSLSSSVGHQQNLGGSTTKAGVSSLSLVFKVIFPQNGWSQGRGLGLIFQCPCFCQ